MKNISPISVTLPYRNISELDSLCNDVGFLIMKEIWKDIEGYGGLYQVSNLARVKSLKRQVANGRGIRILRERILKQCINDSGYYIVVLSKKGKTNTKYVHQLMAIGFMGHTANGYTLIVDHINNDKLDNRIENLQIITQRENASKDRFRQNYSSNYVGVSYRKRSNVWESYISINGHLKYLGNFKDELEASIAYQNKLKQL